MLPQTAHIKRDSRQYYYGGQIKGKRSSNPFLNMKQRMTFYPCSSGRSNLPSPCPLYIVIKIMSSGMRPGEQELCSTETFPPILFGKIVKKIYSDKLLRFRAILKIYVRSLCEINSKIFTKLTIL